VDYYGYLINGGAMRYLIIVTLFAALSACGEKEPEMYPVGDGLYVKLIKRDGVIARINLFHEKNMVLPTEYSVDCGTRKILGVDNVDYSNPTTVRITWIACRF
jgi:hypothetical protein